MKALIIYDSVFSNTEQIAQAMANALGSQQEVEILRVNNVKSEHLIGLDLLIAGSPTLGGKPSPSMLNFLNKIPASACKGIQVASFDTRLATKMVGIFGYAAGIIAKSLEEKGGTLIASPEGFFVKGRKGPLKEGELERATNWMKTVVQSEK